jgi:hypothetical protein
VQADGCAQKERAKTEQRVGRQRVLGKVEAADRYVGSVESDVADTHFLDAHVQALAASAAGARGRHGNGAARKPRFLAER